MINTHEGGEHVGRYYHGVIVSMADDDGVNLEIIKIINILAQLEVNFASPSSQSRTEAMADPKLLGTLHASL